MGAKGPDKIVKLLFDAISDEGVSVHQIVCRTGLDHRTVKKYVDLVIELQNAPKIIKQSVGLRVMVRKTS